MNQTKLLQKRSSTNAENGPRDTSQSERKAERPRPERGRVAEQDRQEIEAKGGRLATLAEFLDLAEHEMRMIDLKIGLDKSIRRLRTEAKLTQAALSREAGRGPAQDRRDGAEPARDDP